MNLALKRSARMAWNAVMRFGCCLCICGILLGSVAAPKAKAVATEAAVVGFSPAILALYMKSAGLSLTATSSAAGAAAMTEMIGGYAAATGTTASAVSGSIAAGAAISTSGAIILGVAAVSLLAALTAWAISEYKLEPGGDSVPVFSKAGICYSDTPYGTSLDSDTVAGFYVIGDPAVYYCSNGLSFAFNNNQRRVEIYDADGALLNYSAMTIDKGQYWAFANFTDTAMVVSCYNGDGQHVSGHQFASPITIDYLGSVSGEASSVSLSPDYETVPEVLETQQMVIDFGAGEGATEDTVTTLVFNNIVDGTLDPTYEVTDVDPGTDTEPDVDPDTGGDTGSGTEDFPDPESLGLADLGDALTTRFPFSIPWDLYRAVKLLVAPAEAPYFEIDFLQPIAYRLPKGWQGSTTIVFDMAEYELIGQVSRWTSTVGFCLALIAGSKRYIWMS